MLAVPEEMSLVGFTGLWRLWLFSWIDAVLYRSCAELRISLEDVSDRLLTLCIYRECSPQEALASSCYQKKTPLA